MAQEKTPPAVTPVCPWDFKAVEKPGFTCDETCYALFYAWMWSSANMVYENPSGKLVALSEGEAIPLPIRDQPWALEKNPLDRATRMLYGAGVSSSD